MAEIRKMICVGKKRGFDGCVTSYDLVEYGDVERNVKNYSVDYIEAALKRREMVISNIKLNPEGGITFVDPNKDKPKVQIDVDEDVDEKPDKKKKTYKRKKKSYSKKKRR